jgi:hypothetical protein
MRKGKNQIVRLQRMIENDRITSGDNFINLVACDTEKLLKEYFDIKDKLQLKIEKTGDEYNVLISFKANRIKNFINIPKE